MDIASGILHGLSLQAPKGDTTRPTTIRSRQALFDSLGDLHGFTVVDLFAGSGALGLEAASRGADSVFFVEGSKSVCRVIHQNCSRADALSPSAAFTTLNLTLPGGLARLTSNPRPDLIFADPPYAESPKLLADMLADESFTAWAANALLIWETASDKGGLQPPPPTWKLENIRIFGGAKFLFLRTVKS